MHDGADGTADDTAADGAADDTAADGGRRAAHPIVGGVTAVLAGLLVLAALITPNDVTRLAPAAFVRIPAEGLLGLALVLALPAKARRIVAILGGAVLGLLTIVKFVDMGFATVLARSFNPVLDWGLFGSTVDFLTGSIGRLGAIGVVILAAVLVVVVPALMAMSTLRVTRIVVRHQAATRRVTALLTVVWIACAAFGVHFVPGVPVAGDSVAALAKDHALQVRASLQDEQAFAAASAVDAFGATPGSDLLTGLRGKDVVVAFVESYGRSAVADPQFAPQVDAVLDAGSRQLSAAGFASRSAFLTSPTSGGGSWLAHATFLSGLWIDSQQRYHTLVSSNRLTLTSAFRKASSRTVAVMPGTNRAWPERGFYGYEGAYDARNLGYHGKPFSWISSMPDQYTLEAFERSERAVTNRAPIMAEIDLTSSHEPWAPIPRLIDWKDVNDGPAFDPMTKEGDPPDVVWRDPTQIRTAYRRSIEYSLNTLISYVQHYGDNNLVLVFLGDHQPAPIVVGAGASRDVPVTIVARDPAVLDKISGWGWQDGLRPGPTAPVWRMDAFRDRFLTAFGSQAGSASLPPPVAH